MSKTSNTFDIWPLLVKWGSIFKNRIITYISVNVGHSDLILDMEVKVIYRCHMSPAKLKYLYKRKTCHHLLANALKMEFDLYLHESRSQWPNSWNVGQCDLEVSKMSNTFDIWPFLVKWGAVFKKRIMTYISVKVGHSDLILGMEVKVIYRCHMSPTKLKYLYRWVNVPPFTC